MPAPSAAVAETAGRKVGWLEFLGLVDSSASDSDSASTSRSIQPAEVETRMQQVAGMDQLDGTVASCKETASRRDSIVQTEIVPLVEAHWLDLLQELRLSELVLNQRFINSRHSRKQHMYAPPSKPLNLLLFKTLC